MAETQYIDETLDEGRDMDGGEKKAGMSPEKKKKILVLTFGLVGLIGILGGGGTVAYMVFLGGGHGGGEVPVDTSALRKPGAKDLPMYYTFPTMTVDIKSAGHRTRYVKVEVLAEVYFKENMDYLKAVEPKMVDGFQTYLRSRTPAQLSGRAGTEDVRQAFEQIAREAMGHAHKINAILFKEILVQ